MTVKEIYNYLVSKVPDLYGVSFSLLRDDLQSSQIVIDSLQMTLIENPKFIQDLIDSERDPEDKFSLFLKALKQCAFISLKRWGQLPHQNFENYQPLAMDILTPQERLILFLVFKLKLNFEEISLVLDQTKLEVIGLFQTAKFRYIKEKGNEEELQEMQGNCPHSRVAFNYFGTPFVNKDSKYLSNHLVNCSHCGEYFSFLKEVDKELDLEMPIHPCPPEVVTQVQLEIKELLKELNFRLTKDWSKYFHFFKIINKDLCTTILSWKMVKYYVSGVILWLGLRYIFH